MDTIEGRQVVTRSKHLRGLLDRHGRRQFG
jgi:hypothetical protein